MLCPRCFLKAVIITNDSPKPRVHKAYETKY